MEHKDRCFFCGKELGQLRKACTFRLDKKVRECAKVLQDSDLLAKLSCGDMMAQDALYHATCLLNLYKKANQLNSDANGVSDEKELHGIVLAELASFIEQAVEEEGISRIFKMTDLADLYRSRLIDLGGTAPDRIHSTRLKTRLLAHFEGLKEFREGKETFLAFDDDLCTVLKVIYEQNYDDDAFVLSKAADILRRDIFTKQNENFDGKFNVDSQICFAPQSLSSFIDMLLQGTNINNNKKHLEQSRLTICQLIGQNVVRRSRKESSSNYRSKERESPLGIYLGMMIHAKTRKKNIVDKLYDLGISIPYSRVMELSTSLGNKVLFQYEQDRVVCPPSLRKHVFTTAALDNIDHNPSSTTADGSFHGTGISLFQHPTKNNTGEEQQRQNPIVSNNKLSNLPKMYANVRAVTSYNREPDFRDYSNIQHELDVEEELKKEER